MKDPATTPRNSSVREIIRPGVESVAKVAHEKLPWMKAWHISLGGLATVIAGTVLAVRGHRIAATVAQTGGGITDFFDGPVSRLNRAENLPELPQSQGQLVDTLADRGKEASIFIGHAIVANQRGDIWGELMGFTEAISCTASSIWRAFAESEGKIAPETGSGISALGTHPIRMASGIAGTAFPKLQAPLDMIGTVANIARGKDCYDIYQNGEALPPDDPGVQEMKDEALKRAGALILATGGIIVASLITAAILHRPRRAN